MSIKLSKRDSLLKQKLNYHYRYFDKEKISPDPLEFPHRFENFYDIEISAFIASIFAYGNITQIMKVLNLIHEIMGNSPHEFISNFHKLNKNPFEGIKHRFYTSEDIFNLFKVINSVYSNYGSFRRLFILYYFPNEENIKNALQSFSENLLNIWQHFAPITNGAKFMFPLPAKGSTCKRMNLFLRWMIRKDELDFGYWNEISADRLVIPVDTHIARICKELKLTKVKNTSWKMAEEITQNLKKFNSDDPVKYDFAICHIGMRKLDF